MKARTRSISGALMMLVIIPMFAGLLACMPEYVPLGNPERARVDPDMTGLWYSPESAFFIGHLSFLQPWDKRTWLMVTAYVELEAEFDEDDEDPDKYDLDTYEGFINVVSTATGDDVDIAVVTHKAWLVRIAGETFLTLEWRGLPNEASGSLEPWVWNDLRIEEKARDRIVMRPINTEFPPLQEAPETPKAWERVVRKHIDNEDLYLDEQLVLQRVKPEDEELMSDLLEYVFLREGL
jgi:hypothetical protein